MKNYKDFTQIDQDLKRLNLERQITLEEIKYVKNEFESSMKPLSILGSFAKFAGKYGALIYLKKLFK